jgi:hypothetical protein
VEGVNPTEIGNGDDRTRGIRRIVSAGSENGVRSGCARWDIQSAGRDCTDSSVSTYDAIDAPGELVASRGGELLGLRQCQ